MDPEEGIQGRHNPFSCVYPLFSNNLFQNVSMFKRAATHAPVCYPLINQGQKLIILLTLGDKKKGLSNNIIITCGSNTVIPTRLFPHFLALFFPVGQVIVSYKKVK